MRVALLKNVCMGGFPDFCFIFHSLNQSVMFTEDTGKYHKKKMRFNIVVTQKLNRISKLPATGLFLCLRKLICVEQIPNDGKPSFRLAECA